MRNFKKNLKEGFVGIRKDEEKGTLVETILITAVIAAMIGLVALILWRAIKSQGEKTGKVIQDGGAIIK